MLSVFVLKTVVPCLYWWHVGSGCDSCFTLSRIIGMRLRTVDLKAVITAVHEARLRGIEEELDLYEAHFLAGGDVLNVVRGLVAAKERGFALDFARAAAIDLAARDVVQVVRQVPSAEEFRKLADRAGEGLTGERVR